MYVRVWLLSFYKTLALDDAFIFILGALGIEVTF